MAESGIRGTLEHIGEDTETRANFLRLTKEFAYAMSMVSIAASASLKANVIKVLEAVEAMG